VPVGAVDLVGEEARRALRLRVRHEVTDFSKSCGAKQAAAAVGALLRSSLELAGDLVGFQVREHGRS
jgi:hypothetical protein